MRLLSEKDIHEQVARAVEKNVPRLLTVLSRVTPAFLVDNLYGRIRRGLPNGKIAYRMYCFADE
jgi:hypothetical protein